jgi:Flp pilus assembly protein TadG
MKQVTPMLRIPGRPGADQRARERGQILVLFALGAIVLIAMVGLVLDGGDTYAQRRDEQNGADMAAMAGANAYMNQPGSVTAKTNAARSAAVAAGTRNGYTQGTASTTVNVAVTLMSSGATVKVDITRPHTNAFARVMGFNQWPVTVTASALAGTIDTAVGAAPWIMNIGAFNADGSPKYTSSNPIAFGEANGDYPVSATDLAWTDFNGNNNVNTSEVAGIIAGTNIVTSTVDYDQYIGQHNQGNHTALYADVNAYLAGKDVPVPIVGPGSPDCAAPQQAHQDGCYKGWALFHVVSAAGGSSKTITGYFLDDFVSEPLTVGSCTPAQQAAGTCGVISSSPFGQYVVKLTD